MISRATLKRIPPVNKSYRALKYLAYQVRLGITAWKDSRSVAQMGVGIPLPPGRLRYRVHGDLDAASFVRTGQTVAGNVQSLMKAAGHELRSFTNVLDFGCGCGRVLAHLAGEGLPAGRSGSDIDREAITWCEQHIPAATWRVNQFLPPLSWPDHNFDFVFSISVFTHLDQEMQNAWLAELARVSRPGGMLLLTVHGEFVHATLPADQREALRQSGFLYVTGATGRLKLDGLPDFYQTAFHTPGYVRTHWSRYFEVVAIVPRGINDHQDAVILRKR